jgi:hypothetical protein
MAEQPTTLFDSPAGDGPAPAAYRPGMWLVEPPPAAAADEPGPPAARRPPTPRAGGAHLAQPGHRLLLHRLQEAENRLAGPHHGGYWDDAPPAA